MPNHRPLPDRSFVLEHLRYDPESGLFWWVKRGHGRPVGRPAGTKLYRSGTGEPNYMQVRLSGSYWALHRLAWLIAFECDPAEMTIDHINRNPFDNRICNLRLADASLQNRNRRNVGASRHKGVHYWTARDKWRAMVKVDGRMKLIGNFDTEEEAAVAAYPHFIH